MDFYKTLDSAMANLAGFLWGTPLVVLLLGGGIFFAAYSRMVPMLYFKHGIDILLGKYDSDDDPGQITHFEALSSALAGTVGMGNIAGVAVAIHTGGPGAIFWMWITAILGMSTKFFTCTLALMYRGQDDQGEIQGGVMYYIEEGLGRSYRPLAIMFSVSGLLGCIVFFQANQLSQIIRDFFYTPLNMFQSDPFIGNMVTGIIVAVLVGTVIFGGIQRIAKVASKLVPTMVGLYIIAAILILAKNIGDIPGILRLIIEDAFNGDAVSGGALGSLIIIGVRRGMFSNEAGTGTETMAHGAAKTKEPVREGLVAMLGPLIDTIIVCTITALIILTTGMWKAGFDAKIININPEKQELTVQISKLYEMDSPTNKWLDYSIKSKIFDSDGILKEPVIIEFEIDSILSETEVIIREVYDDKYIHIGYGKYKEKGKENDESAPMFSKTSVLTDSTISVYQLGNTYLIPLSYDNIKQFKWQNNGVTLTTLAFKKELGFAGQVFLTIAVLTFALSTMFGYSYYGQKCASYVFGTRWKNAYNWVYVVMIVVGSVASIEIAVNFVDSAYALMVIPTMISTFLLAPRVLKESKRYFSSL